MSDEDPGDGAFEGGFEVLGEPSAAAEPGEGALDHPSAWQELEAVFGGVGAPDDLEGPRTEWSHGVAQLVAAIAAIGEHMAQPRIEGADRRQQVGCAVTVLDVGGVNLQANQMALGVGDDMGNRPSEAAGTLIR